MASGDLGHASQPSLGVGDHPGRTLHSGLDDQARERPTLRARAIEHLLHTRHAFPLATPVRPGIGALGSGSIEGTAVTPGRGYRLGGKQERRPSPMEEIDLPHTDRSDRVPMIGTLHRHEARFANQPAATRVLGSQLKRGLHRRGTIVRIKDLREPGLPLRSPRQPHQLLGQLCRGSTSQTQGRSVRHSGQLTSNGRVDARIPMTMEIGPNGGVGIEVLPALHVAQDRPLPFDQHNGLGAQPVLHLGERMPDVLVIELGQAVHQAASPERLGGVWMQAWLKASSRQSRSAAV